MTPSKIRQTRSWPSVSPRSCLQQLSFLALGLMTGRERGSPLSRAEVMMPWKMLCSHSGGYGKGEIPLTSSSSLSAQIRGEGGVDNFLTRRQMCLSGLSVRVYHVSWRSCKTLKNERAILQSWKTHMRRSKKLNVLENLELPLNIIPPLSTSLSPVSKRRQSLFPMM